MLLSAVTHAGWNLLARRHRANDIFLRILVVIAIVGVPPTIILEFISQPVFPVVWMLVAISAVFQGIYFWGVTGAYRSIPREKNARPDSSVGSRNVCMAETPILRWSRV